MQDARRRGILEAYLDYFCGITIAGIAISRRGFEDIEGVDGGAGTRKVFGR